MKIIALSDNHGILPIVGSADLLLVAGDMVPSFAPMPLQKQFLLGPFSDWLNSLDIKRKVIVSGNHDTIFQADPDFHKNLPCDYLLDESIEIDGLKIYGTPWQPWFWDWAFNARKEDSEIHLAEIFSKIPEDIDVLMSHSPPSNCSYIGSTSLLEAIQRTKPQLSIFGHHHPSTPFKSKTVKWEDGGKTIFTNVSIINPSREQVYDPREYSCVDGRIKMSAWEL